MKKLILLFYLFAPAPLFAQLHEISLTEITASATLQNFNIIEVIDGRKNKRNIGWVQTGMFNKKKIAVFESLLLKKYRLFFTDQFPWMAVFQLLPGLLICM